MKFCIAFALAAALRCAGGDLLGLPEHLRPDPFGGIVEADRVAGAAPAHQIVLESGRAAYASCHLIAILPEGGAYGLETQGFPAESGLQTDLYREWFHFLTASKRFYPG